MTRSARHIRRMSRRSRQRAALGGLLTAGVLLTGGVSAPDAEGVTLIRSDLDFMLQQIRIAEAHAAGGALSGPGPLQIGSPLLPFGLRTVDGTSNNLVAGQELFGSADRIFPRLLSPLFRTAEPLPFDPDGPGPLAAGSPTSYAQTTPDLVIDSKPRIISNLIVDATANNPAAAAAATATPGSSVVDDGVPGTADPFFIPNRAPDAALSAPYNSWFTFFGQFFDHGLDLVTKGGNGAVMVPLQADDPLIAGPDGVVGNADDLPPQLQFMVLTRATNQPGGVQEHKNTTTPFVDQNQTYTSHPSHQVFLREYELNAAGRPVATGRMLDGAAGGLPTWADVKAQAAMLGITLSDQQILNVPKLQTDVYGKFTPAAATGGAQLTGGGTGHAFLDDIAHHAVPGTWDHDNDPTTAKVNQTPDALAGTADDGLPGTYDDEFLNVHFVTGDGRGNENIGLTTVHHVFHAEHNRLVDHIKAVVSQDPTFLTQWQISPGVWNGERLFQAARFATEMQYQHLVFEEFARKVQPQVNVFAGYDSTIDPAIVAEFAHTVYRFGHSMLPETVARMSPAGADQSLPLVQAFLNPLAFANAGTPAQAAGAIVRGNVRQVGNELDEFVTDAVRSNLLGLPLDLATINLVRGRETGVPSLNSARQKFFTDTNNSLLAPYTSWTDFGLGLRHPESLVNFVAAYGIHPDITAATTVAAKRTVAAALVDGTHLDSATFLAGPAATTGVDDVDFWIGGLAEKPLPFGGLLGSTFNFVFETQLEKLQDGDRLYYLHRLAGTNFLSELEANSFAAMIMRNTDATHLPGDVFSRPDVVIERADTPTGTPRVGDPWVIPDDPATPANEARTLASVTTTPGPAPTDQLRFVGGEHIIMGGRPVADNLRADDGDDTLWGDAGNDRLEGGAGNDIINGGTGNDIINDSFGDDNIKGDAGHDAINAGPGLDLILGGDGNDFVIGGADPKEIFAGNHNDIVQGGDSSDTVFGGAGDDWLEGGNQVDALVGGSGAPFEDATTDGNDVLDGQGGDDDQHGEGGDDILKSGTGIELNEGMLGFDWVTHKGDPQPANADLSLSVLLPPDIANIRDRFRLVEGLSGWNQNDILRGDDATAATMLGNTLDNPGQIGLIPGLGGVLGAGVTSFTGGNIILGGNGSDIIEGRAGNDIIDGDKWLDVQLQAGAAPPVDSVAALQSGVFGGTINPGDVTIRREIKPGAPGPLDVDTVEFSGARSEYSISAGPTVTVTHLGAVAPINDGTDTLTGIERLRFTDQTVVLVANPNNNPATGQPTVNDLTPVEGQTLTASPGTLADTDGFNPATIVYSWQAETAPGTGAWVTVGTGPSFTPGPGETGLSLRVVATFQDNGGVSESGTSAPTAAVENVNNLPTGAPVLSDTSPVVGSALSAAIGSIVDSDGLANATFAYQWQQGSGGTFTNILFATGASFTPTQGQLGQQLRVRVTFTDDNGAQEAIVSAATIMVVAARVPADVVPDRVVQPLLPTNITTARVAPIGTVKGVSSLSAPLVVRFRLGGAAKVRMDVKTTKGVLVRRFNRQVKKAGLVSIKWNLRNAKGLRVTSAPYRIVVSIANADGTTKFTRTVQVR